jgi:hypothetical protein
LFNHIQLDQLAVPLLGILDLLQLVLPLC